MRTVAPLPHKRSALDLKLAGLTSLSSWLSLLRAAAVPAAIASLALALRLYHLTLLGWVPDSYERMLSTQRLLSADFPLSRIYPPGVAIILAPAFAVFPQTLATLQAVVVASGVGLVLLAYFGTLKLTRDRAAAAIFALIVATDSAYVYASRDALFDTIVSLLLGLAVFLLPLLRGRGVLAFVAYGFLLSLLVGIRPTNVACFPALLLYWVDAQQASFRPAALLRTLFSRDVLVTGASFAALTVLYAVLGGWIGGASGAQLTLSTFPSHVLFYVSKLLYGPVGIVVLTPLLILGARSLWRINRPLALAVFWVLATWPLIHAPFFFESMRYMLPARFFVAFLASLGITDLWHHAEPSRALRLGRVYVGLSLVVFAALLAVSVVGLLHDWPRIAAQSDEGMFREVRPVMAGLEDNSLIVSAVSRGLTRKSPDQTYLDLIDLTLARGNTLDGSVDADAAIQTALDQHRPVYYLASRWEAGIDFQGGGRDGYGRYLDAVSSNFEMTELFRTRVLNLDQFPWVLYRVEVKPGASPPASTLTP